MSHEPIRPIFAAARIFLRPWGYYQVCAGGTRWKTKILVIDPGKGTSMQRHMHRTEHWLVLEGTARVMQHIDLQLLSSDQARYHHEGDKLTICKHQWHQLHNPGKIPLVVVETWMGEYLDEDDIERV